MFTFKLALSDTEPALGFCLGIIWRQWDKTINDLGKILSSPLLVFPELKENVLNYRFCQKLKSLENGEFNLNIILTLPLTHEPNLPLNKWSLII